MAKRIFTLVELVVVLAIIMIVAGIVALSFRGESDSVAINNAVLEFEAFVAMVRYRTAELGRDLVIKYDSSGKNLTASPDYTTEELEKMALDNEEEPEVHSWKLPDRCQLGTVDGMERAMYNDSSAEVIRFFPDGGGSASHTLLFRCGNLARKVNISFLTGRLTIINCDGNADHEEEERSGLAPAAEGYDGVVIQ